MNTTMEFEYLLTKAQDLHFKEGLQNVEEIYSKLFKKGDSSNHDYRDATSVGIGKPGYTNQGGMMHLDQYTPGTERVTSFKKFTLGLVVPEELMDDMASNKRVREDKVGLFKSFAKDGAEGFVWLNETICTQFQTLATSTTATNTWPGAGRDSVALAGTHTTARGSVTWINNMTASTLNPVAIAEAITILESQPDETGRPQSGVKEITIQHGRYWTWRAAEIDKSTGQLDTANNNPNLLKTRNIKIKFQENPHLSESDKSWLVFAGHHKMTYFEKQKPTHSKLTDVYTGNRIFRIMSRFGIDFFSARGVVYNAGL